VHPDRQPDSAIRQDAIRLGTAETFIKRMHGTLEASAHAELHAGAFYQRVSSVAQRYANDCRFGHTFRGSFGFTIESPVGSRTPDEGDAHALAMGEELVAPPLERLVVQRLARGLRTVEAAIEKEDPTLITEGYGTGLNANACEELTALVSEPQVSEVRFQILFSPEWGVPSDLGDAPTMTISQARGVAILQEAAKVLRAVDYDISMGLSLIRTSCCRARTRRFIEPRTRGGTGAWNGSPSRLCSRASAAVYSRQARSRLTQGAPPSTARCAACPTRVPA